MLDGMRNLRTSDILLRRRLPQLECDWVVGRLCSRRDIAGAECAGDARRLTIEYDADRLRSRDLVDFLNECGIEVAGVRMGLSRGVTYSTAAEPRHASRSADRSTDNTPGDSPCE